MPTVLRVARAAAPIATPARQRRVDGWQQRRQAANDARCAQQSESDLAAAA
jgi:hypothetical protein